MKVKIFTGFRPSAGISFGRLVSGNRDVDRDDLDVEINTFLASINEIDKILQTEYGGFVTISVWYNN